MFAINVLMHMMIILLNAKKKVKIIFVINGLPLQWATSEMLNDLDDEYHDNAIYVMILTWIYIMTHMKKTFSVFLAKKNYIN
jgi:hypothetical protein